MKLFIATNLDSILLSLIFILSIIGLIRGFLNELVSLINWSGSFYFTSKIKPLVIPILKEKIQIPFLLDIMVNAVVFVSLMIILSILNKYLASKIKRFIPTSTNNGLGLMFGGIKGILLGGFVIAFLNVIYKGSTKQPDWLYDSYSYNVTKDKNSVFTNVINAILGDLINMEKKVDDELYNKEKNSDSTMEENIFENIENNDIDGKNMEQLLDTIFE